MNILCVYWKNNPDYTENNPAQILSCHSVTIVNNHEDMMLMLRDGEFDIVLCDISYPTNSSDDYNGGPYGAIFAMKQDIPEYQKFYKVKALGMFMPRWSTEAYHDASTENQLVVVAANRFITIDGYRDWEKLFNAIVFRLNRAGIII